MRVLWIERIKRMIYKSMFRHWLNGIRRCAWFWLKIEIKHTDFTYGRKAIILSTEWSLLICCQTVYTSISIFHVVVVLLMNKPIIFVRDKHKLRYFPFGFSDTDGRIANNPTNQLAHFHLGRHGFHLRRHGMELVARKRHLYDRTVKIYIYLYQCYIMWHHVYVELCLLFFAARHVFRLIAVSLKMSCANGKSKIITSLVVCMCVFYFWNSRPNVSHWPY